ncbi:ComEC/Rec2 family competence protein [Pedobacter rhodius]|uniref:Metallo-beta-lactamase domain-containing protein n=1 Tax=Pedobacter rhodius TaxID=3004098 RepID=A0ABT4KWH7_9SPHI|nr:MBL fold metallo-hydrolase [Pedobacter sp. SJ11]MCZ4223275.1 hypothetical protein [Pedobacter sp. SJ11]
MKQPYLNIHQVKCGDAFSIRFKSGGKQHNIFIDGGYLDTYFSGIKPLIKSIDDSNEKIDLWILTHLDADHINGAVSFLRDGEYRKKKLVKELWFNCFDRFSLPATTSKKSVGKGIEIRDVLKPMGSILKNNIFNKKSKDIGDAKIQVLWPNKSTLTDLGEHWKKEERKFWDKKTSTKKSIRKKEYDYSKTIEELADKKDPKLKKVDITNRASIAFIFSLDKKKILFLGDCFVSDIIPQLQLMVDRNKNKVKFDYVKLSHHGSKANFHPSILDLIECENYILSADGVNSNHLPSKQTLAKILLHKGRDVKSEKINFLFNYEDAKLKRIFDKDKDAFKRYNFTCIFPKAGKTILRVPL